MFALDCAQDGIDEVVVATTFGVHVLRLPEEYVVTQLAQALTTT